MQRIKDNRYQVIKDGRINMKNLMQLQKNRHDEESDIYNRYVGYWDTGISRGNRELDGLCIVPKSDPNGDIPYHKEHAMRSLNIRSQNIGIEDDVVWVGIKFANEDAYYNVKDVYGRNLTEEEFKEIQEDSRKYQEFELRCWSGVFRMEFEDKDDLHKVISRIFKVETSAVIGDRIDSEFNALTGEILISFKAQLERSKI